MASCAKLNDYRVAQLIRHATAEYLIPLIGEKREIWEETWNTDL